MCRWWERRARRRPRGVDDQQVACRHHFGLSTTAVPVVRVGHPWRRRPPDLRLRWGAAWDEISWPAMPGGWSRSRSPAMTRCSPRFCRGPKTAHLSSPTFGRPAGTSPSSFEHNRRLIAESLRRTSSATRTPPGQKAHRNTSGRRRLSEDGSQMGCHPSRRRPTGLVQARATA